MEIAHYFAVCIAVRLSLALAVWRFREPPIQSILALGFAVLSVGALYQYVMKTRQVGAFHNKVWWDHLRPIHSFLFACTAYGVWVRYPYAYLFVLLDTFIGVVGFSTKK